MPGVAIIVYLIAAGHLAWWRAALIFAFVLAVHAVFRYAIYRSARKHMTHREALDWAIMHPWDPKGRRDEP